MKKSGVVALRNLKTDKVYVFYADDIEKECISQRFSLDLGMHGCAMLQKDYADTGLEVFRFDTLEETSDRSRLDYWTMQFRDRYTQEES